MKKILLLGFAMLLLINFASAELVCCEQTNTGDTCQYVDDSKCNADFKSAPTNCVFTSFCKPGCCFNLNDGRCYDNMPLATCVAATGDTSYGEDPECVLPQCEVGCCILGNEASLITQTRCKKEVSNYPDLQMVFKEEIKDEEECVALARSAEKGCCVTDSDNCAYGIRGNCELKTGTDLAAPGFFKDKFCSDSDLICDCVKEHKKGCLPGSDDLYWFDSCDNPERVAENCDYVNEQTTCGQNLDGEYECLDLKCKTDYDVMNLNPETGELSMWRSENAEVKNGESWCEYDSPFIGFGRDVPGSRYYRGVCINNKIRVEACKDFREEYCISATVDIEGTDYREAACRVNRWDDCTSVTVTDWEDDDLIDDAETNCLNTDLRDCTWTGKVDSPCEPYVPPGGRFWEDEQAGICSAADSTCEVTFSVGGISNLLAGGEDVPLLNDIFSGAEDISGGLIQEIGGGWECIKGCLCLTHDYLVNEMNECRYLGDCGAHFNMQKTRNAAILLGFEDSTDIPDHLEDIVREAGGPPGEIEFDDLEDFEGVGLGVGNSGQMSEQERLMQAAMTGFLSRAFIHGIYGMDFGKGPLNFKNLFSKTGTTFKSFGQSAYGSFGQSGSGKGGMFDALFPDLVTGCDVDMNGIKEDMAGLMIKEQKQTAKEFENEIKYGDVPEEIVSPEMRAEWIKEIEKGEFVPPKEYLDYKNKEYIGGLSDEDILSEYSGMEGGLSTGGGPFCKGAGIADFLNQFFSAYSTLAMIDSMLAETETIEITTACKSWQAPTGSLDCEKCNPADSDERQSKLCSEYTCKSFGQACALVNKGTGNETCVTQNPRDANSPVITIWDNPLKLYNTEKTPTGYRYLDEINAFEIFPLGIKTDEPAQCRMSLEDVSFDEMTEFFGPSLYLYDHLSLTTFPHQLNATEEGKLEVAPGREYLLFVKCQDALENKNERPFTISFTIETGPDTTSPVIEGSSITSGSYVQYGINETKVTIYVSEPAECRWSRIDQKYEEMNSSNQMDCVTNRINDVGLFECEDTFTPIIDQVLNLFYIRCMDKPGAPENDRNVNAQSYKLSLRGSFPLVLDYIKPEGEINSRNFTLEVGTLKGATLDGKAYCYYDNTGTGSLNINGMIPFFKTNASVHKQVLAPVRRNEPYNFTVICVDYGANMVNTSTQIIMQRDVDRPYVQKIYEDDTYTPTHLKVIMNEPVDCQYKIGNDFTFGDGVAMSFDSTEHDALFEEGVTYYIKCLDPSDNLMTHVFHS